MCTVTYIPVPDGFYLTSNRDEQQCRPAAVEPHTCKGRTGMLLFPKDARAGGTWFAAHEKGTVAVLLNGAWHKHRSQPPYRRSRGLVLLELVDQSYAAQAFSLLDLEGIEPFTMVLWENGILHECRWDGTTKHHLTPDPALPHIWSSVTLYTAEAIRERAQWFHAWVLDHPVPSMEDVFGFHRFTGSDDRQNGIMMSGDGLMLTVSITALHHRQGGMEMVYADVPADTVFHRSFSTPATYSPL
jgi:hypothetical protein